MIENNILKSNFLGRDGFRWWVGQINIIDESKESYVLFHSNFSQLRLVKIVLYENIN